MKTLLYVFVPESTGPFELEDTLYEILEPFRLKQDDTIQPHWHFDYLCWFEPTLNCAATDAELPPQLHHNYAGHITRLSRLSPDALPGAVVTTDGQWHDLSDFGFRLMNDAKANAIAEQNWRQCFWDLVDQSPNCWVIETWAHS